MRTATARIAAQQVSETLDLSQVYQPVRGHRGVAGLPAAVRKIVELFDGRRSMAEVAEAARISEARLDAVVRKLTSCGMLRPQGRPPRTLRAMPATRSGFSELEEAFFASEVAPIDECDLPFETVGERLMRAVGALVTRSA